MSTPDHGIGWVEPQRILIVRLGALGDIIHALPAVGALRRRFPHAEIGWVVEERWAELLCAPVYPRSGPRSPQRPLVDRLHFVNTKRWRQSWSSPETWHEIAVAISDLSGPAYQVAVDFQGSIRSALIARLSRADNIYGFAQPRESIASMFYSHPVFSDRPHVVDQNMALAEALAHERLTPAPVEFPSDSAAERKCENRLQELALTGFVLLNPGAGWGAKQWPAERYAEVARELTHDNLTPLINFGPQEEALANAVKAASAGAATPISCSLAELTAFARRAQLFIAGDTGPLHLAAALKVPVVAIFGPTDPVRNGPYGTRSIVLRSPSSHTSHSHRAEPDPGLLEITPGQVLNAARELLGSKRG
ncbi:MAG TPA: lipopolysaccharide heptosyltransferase I [Terriglobales bacterium]